MPYWVWAQKANGRPIIGGPHKSEDEATNWIMECISDPARREAAEIIPLTTRNKAEATQQLKHRMARSVGIDTATRYAHHPKGQEVSL